MVHLVTGKSKGLSSNPAAVDHDTSQFTVSFCYFLMHILHLLNVHIMIDEELYTLHELDNTLTVQQVPTAPNGTSPIFATVNITPPNPPAGAYFAAGEILIPTPTDQFQVPYIYVSNRNTGTQDPRGDAIAIYERTANSQDELTLVTHVYTGLDQIRAMEFGSASNGGVQYLIAGGVAGTAGVVILKRTDGGRGLEVVARNTDIPTRTSFVWL
jgi:hypothetical protein